jgi:hypothetical protein
MMMVGVLFEHRLYELFCLLYTTYLGFNLFHTFFKLHRNVIFIIIFQGPVVAIGTPLIQGGEDKDPEARERRDTVKKVRSV